MGIVCVICLFIVNGSPSSFDIALSFGYRFKKVNGPFDAGGKR